MGGVVGVSQGVRVETGSGTCLYTRSKKGFGTTTLHERTKAFQGTRPVTQNDLSIRELSSLAKKGVGTWLELYDSLRETRRP